MTATHDEGLAVLTLGEARELVDDILATHGVSPGNRAVLVDLIVHTERHGSRSHGLMRLPDYVASIRSGWIDPAAEPTLNPGPGVFIAANGQRGFTQVAAARARPLLVETAQRHGMAALTVSNGHHIGALWCDVEPFAEQGLIAINFVNSRCRLAAYGSGQRLLGTNAMAFSAPDGQGGALTWDQASSVMSLGDVKLHAAAGQALPPGVGLDAHGAPTQDASAVLQGGALLPFAGHKGASIALMVEVMAAALTGANFGFEDDSGRFPGAASSNAGQCLLVIDPEVNGQASFARRMRDLVTHLRTDESVRLPGDRRRQGRITTAQDPLTLPTASLSQLRALRAAGVSAIPS